MGTLQQGSLDVEKLEELFKDLSQNQFTGSLAAYDENAWKEFYFASNGVRVTSIGVNKVLPLGEIMVRKAMISARDVDRGVERMREKRVMIGEALVDLRIIDEEDLGKALRLQADLEMLELYYWRRPTFEYRTGMQSVRCQIVERKRAETGTRSLSVTYHPLDLIQNGRALYKEVADIKTRLTSLSHVFRLNEKGRAKIFDTGAFKTLGTMEQRVIIHIDGRKTLGEIFEKARVLWVDVIRVVDNLLRHGAIIRS
jgi:hypothetical protein